MVKHNEYITYSCWYTYICVSLCVQELAGLFHSFYNQCRIIGVDNDLQQARLALVLVVKHVLEHALGILGVSAPDHM
jgi:arginyl-tRNA synthetase